MLSISPTFRDIGRELERKAFDCGCPLLNEFLSRYAAQNQRAGGSRTVCAVNGRQILGYITWTMSELRDLRGHRTPVLRIGRMAVDLAFTRQRLGHRLMAEAYKAANAVRLSAGCVGLVVDAKKCTNAQTFYSGLGFDTLNETPDTYEMYMELGKAARP